MTDAYCDQYGEGVEARPYSYLTAAFEGVPESFVARTAEEAYEMIRVTNNDGTVLVHGIPVEPDPSQPFPFKYGRSDFEAPEHLYSAYSFRRTLRPNARVYVVVPTVFTVHNGWHPLCADLSMVEAESWCQVSNMWVDHEYASLTPVAEIMYRMSNSTTRNLYTLIRSMSVPDVIGMYMRSSPLSVFEAIGNTLSSGVIFDKQAVLLARAISEAKNYEIPRQDLLGMILAVKCELQSRNMPLAVLPELIRAYSEIGCFTAHQWLSHFTAYADLRSDIPDMPDELLLHLIEKELKHV